MPTITKPMTIDRAYESAKRFVEDAAKPHKIFMLAAEDAPPTAGYLIPISGAGGPPLAYIPPATEPEPPEEDVEVTAGAIDETGEPVALDPPTEPKRRRRRLPRPTETVYYHNPYKEEPLTPDLCALHLNISRTSFYRLVQEFPDLAKRACKGEGRGMRFTRHALDKWRKLSTRNGTQSLLPLAPTSGRNLAPSERKGVVQPRCTVINRDGQQCRGLAMKGGYVVCSVHAMRETTSAGANGLAIDHEGEEVTPAV